MHASYQIDPGRHEAVARRRCRAALELIGPQLPELGDRPRHYVDGRGRGYAWAPGLGRYIGID